MHFDPAAGGGGLQLSTELCFTTSNYVMINFIALGFIKHIKSYDLKDEWSGCLYAQKACAMHKNRARACYIECPW